MTTAAYEASGRAAYVRLADRLLARRSTRHLVALALFVAFTLVFFHGLALHLGSSVLEGTNDETYAVRVYWAADQAGKTPFTFHRDTLNGAPEGLPLAASVQTANAVQPGFVWLLRGPLGVHGAFNLFLLLGFVLTGFAMYLLVSHLGFGFLPGLYAGYAVAFSPWMIERSYAGHAGYMHAWIFPLLTAVLLRARRTRLVRDAALAGLTFALAFYVSSYYGLLAGAIVVVFWLVDALFRRKGERRRSAALACVQLGVAFAALLPALVAGARDRSAVTATVGHAVKEIQDGGAVLSSYLVPSPRQPLLGGAAEALGLEGTIRGEYILYVGIATLVLALAALVLLVRRHGATLEADRRFVLVFAATLAGVAFLCSLKRQTSVLGVDVPMPSYAIGEVATYWRVYARFGVIVLFALALLAAFTLDVIGRRRRGPLVVLGLFALLVFEFWPGHVPVYRTSPAQPYVAWLAQQPRGIVANYPLPTDSRAANDLMEQAFFDQTKHGQPNFAVFGPGYVGTREEAIRILARYVDGVQTPGVLAAENVRYVLLHDDVYRRQGVTPPQPDPASYRFLARIGDVRAYAVRARPADLSLTLEDNAAAIAQVQGLTAPAVVGYGEGFNAPERGPLGEARWLIQDGRIRLSTDGATATRFRLEGPMFSLRERRTVELVADGRVLGQAPVETSQTAVSLGPFTLPPGSSELGLRATPGPEVIGGGDERQASVYVGPLRMVPLADFSNSLRETSR